MLSKTALLAAAALALVSTVASARDGKPYVGIEGGVTKPDKLKLDYRLGTLSVPNGIHFEHKTGWDVDFIAGYDLGLIRAEAELGMKRAAATQVTVAPAIQFNNTGPLTVDGRVLAKSALVNLLLDFGKDDGLQVYGGGGIGLARVSLNNVISGPNVPAGRGIQGSDRSFAWQLVAGMRAPISYNIDLGLKYRFFRTEIDLSATSNASVQSLEGRFRTHSVLASLIFNLGKQPAPLAPPAAEPAPAPPPPPAPPATQTCPDGSVILATDACPVPPPPPPPPEVAPVRG
jgi:opacity protein-like surface antigen